MLCHRHGQLSLLLYTGLVEVMVPEPHILAPRETGYQSSPCLKNPQRHGDYKTLSELSTRASFPAPWRIFPLEDEGDVLASMTL